MFAGFLKHAGEARVNDGGGPARLSNQKISN
jgi:hypothetical protein